MLAFEGITTTSAPIPLVRCFWLVQHTHKDGDNGQNHDDFNSHGRNADEGAQGAVQQVGNDKLVHG